MCFLMAGYADRSPDLRSYRRERGFTCIVPGDAAHIACNRSLAALEAGSLTPSQVFRLC
jgi:hypothetical protein